MLPISLASDSPAFFPCPFGCVSTEVVDENVLAPAPTPACTPVCTCAFSTFTQDSHVPFLSYYSSLPSLSYSPSFSFTTVTATPRPGSIKQLQHRPAPWPRKRVWVNGTEQKKASVAGFILSLVLSCLATLYSELLRSLFDAKPKAPRTFDQQRLGDGPFTLLSASPPTCPRPLPGLGVVQRRNRSSLPSPIFNSFPPPLRVTE